MAYILIIISYLSVVSFFVLFMSRRYLLSGKEAIKCKKQEQICIKECDYESIICESQPVIHMEDFVRTSGTDFYSMSVSLYKMSLMEVTCLLDTQRVLLQSYLNLPQW